MRRDKRLQEQASLNVQSCGRSSSWKRIQPWQLFLPAYTIFSATPGGCVSPSAELDVKRLWRLSLLLFFEGVSLFRRLSGVRSPQFRRSRADFRPLFIRFSFIFPIFPNLQLFINWIREFSMFSRLSTSGEIHSTNKNSHLPTRRFVRQLKRCHGPRWWRNLSSPTVSTSAFILRAALPMISLLLHAKLKRS